MFIRIEANPDGSHAYQVGGRLEDGWAAVPDGMDLPASWPYVDIVTDRVTHPAITDTRKIIVDGEATEQIVVIVPEYTQIEVVSMTAGAEIPVEIPDDDPVPVSDPADTVYDDLAAAYSEGVQSA